MVSVEFGGAAAGPGVDAPTIAATNCYTVNNMTVNGRSPIGDEDRAFTLTQRGSMSLLTAPGSIAVEAEAHGAFADGQARGTVEVRFVDQPNCNSAPVSWTAQAP